MATPTGLMRIPMLVLCFSALSLAGCRLDAARSSTLREPAAQQDVVQSDGAITDDVFLSFAADRSHVNGSQEGWPPPENPSPSMEK